MSQRAQIRLRFSALAGAFLVGVAGARWITNEADKMLLRESIKKAAEKKIPAEDCEELLNASPRQVLEAFERA